MSQLNIIKNLFQKNNELSIKDISSITWIKEPNIRRILWQWTISWIFKRIDKWVYSLQCWDTTIWFINWDSFDVVKNLKTKFDLVFLDIPYKTIAVTWGNRWVKYDLISPDQFNILLNDLKNCINEDTYIVHCFSNAPSWMKQMLQYNKKLESNWFKLISENTWTKLFSNGNIAKNMRGNQMPPEWINIYSLSGKSIDFNRNWILPKTSVASQKPFEALKDIIESLTSKWSWILDPFAWSWITWFVSLLLWRNCVMIEKSNDRFYNEILIPNI